jgi:DNA-binding NarL/FixJ family response regulator
MLVAGKSITEIADPLHLSVKTVSTHKTNILKKMGMSTMSDMVQYAVRNHLIAPTPDSL